MRIESELDYLRKLGARVLSEANDLKRTPAALAADLGLTQDAVDRVISGEADVSTAQGLLTAMAEIYPISLGDVWAERNDTDSGVLIMRAADSVASRRVFDRRDRTGTLAPYYEYRDTAMSRTAPFKPEWIQQLRFVDDADPDNPEVSYNNGHLMHQTTFFVGEVNFYWRAGGRGYCVEMNTGDSNYIMPLVPHSFASRRRDAPGLIIAVTYSGQVRRALEALGHMGTDAATELAGDLRSTAITHQVRLARHLAAESLTTNGLVKRLVDSGMDGVRATALARSDVQPLKHELQAMAAALHIRSADLMADLFDKNEEVVVSYIRDNPSRPHPDSNRPICRLTELARVHHQPGLKGFEITVVDRDTGPDGEFRHGLHQYVYNYGNDPVNLQWGKALQDTLAPGDSAYLQPMTRHSFSLPAGIGEGHLVAVRVPGVLTDKVLDEYGSYSKEGRGRAVGEDRTWF